MENSEPNRLHASPRGHLDCSLTYSNTECQSNALIPGSNQEIDLMLSKLKHERVRQLKAQNPKPVKEQCFMKLRKVPCTNSVLPNQDTRRLRKQDVRSSSQNRNFPRAFTCHRKAKTEGSEPNQPALKCLKSRMEMEHYKPPNSEPLKYAKKVLQALAKGFLPTKLKTTPPSRQLDNATTSKPRQNGGFTSLFRRRPILPDFRKTKMIYT